MSRVEDQLLKKWVFKIKDEEWHLVGKDDRDWEQGIMQEEIIELHALFIHSAMAGLSLQEEGR